MTEFLIQLVVDSILALKRNGGGKLPPEVQARIHQAALDDADDGIAAGEAALKRLGETP